MRRTICCCYNFQAGALDKPGADGTSNMVLVAELQAEIQVREYIVINVSSVV